MKKKFLIITASSQVDESSFFIHLFAGESERELRLLAEVHDVCDERGWFIAAYSQEVSEFLEKVYGSLGYDMASITAHSIKLDCRRFLDTYDPMCGTSVPTLNQNQRKMLEKIDSRFYFQRQLSIAKK